MYFRGAALLFFLLTVVAQVTHVHGQQPLLSTSGEQFPAFYSKFTRTLHTGARTDSIRGEFYFVEPGHIFMEVTHPVHQIMVIDNEKLLTTIYYPEKNRGFLLESNNPATLPIIPGLIVALQSDYGLSNLGFELYDQEIHADTLITYWQHPEKQAELGRFQLVKVGRHLAYTIYQLPNGGGKAKTTFDEYVTIRDYTFPSVITTERTTANEKAREDLFLTDLQVRPNIPSNVLNFQIPADADVEKKRW